MKKIIAVNIVVILCVLALAELAAWVSTFIYVNTDLSFRQNRLLFPKYRFRGRTFDEVYGETNFRPPTGTEYKKRPLIVFGCSFAYGNMLEDSQTLGYKLSGLTKRPVYNRAYSSWGMQHMLYQLQNEQALNKINNPEYIIYILINDQFIRLTQCYNNRGTAALAGNSSFLRYVDKDGHLEKKYCLGSSNSLFITNLSGAYDNRIRTLLFKNPGLKDRYFELAKLHFLESKALINQKYPNAKIVILKYDFQWLDMPDMWDELEKEGFIILAANELTGADLSSPEYTIPDGHPNEKAWDVIAPALAKKLKL